MDLSFESNIREWSADLRDVERQQLPFATAKALTQTAIDVRKEHVSQLPVIFDRPTRYTINALRVIPANKRTLRATVYFKDSPRHRQHYLLPQVEGGSRPIKRFERWLIGKGIMEQGEFAVPASGATLNAWGNVSPGTITQILSQLSASPDATQWETERSKKRAGARRARYFVPHKRSGLARGIWRKIAGRIEPVFVFVSSVTYDIRYPFFEISDRHAGLLFPMNFQDAMDDAIASARRPGPSR